MDYVCGYCPRGAKSPDEIVMHQARNHDPKSRCIIKIRSINPVTGLSYSSIQTGTNIETMSERVGGGFSLIIDMDHTRIRFKRPSSEQSESSITSSSSDKNEPINSSTPSLSSSVNSHAVTESEIEAKLETIKNMEKMLPELLAVMKKMNRMEDFTSLMNGLVSGQVSPDNICLQCLLDIGRMVSVDSSTQMRYPKNSIDFWSVVYKLLHGKAIRLFGGDITGPRPDGRMSGSTRDPISGFVVPSITTLQNACNAYKMDVAKPGIIKHGIELFAGVHQGDVKICFDGKKMAWGFGKKLGDEDLDGYEEGPTLEERKKRFEEEKQVVEGLLLILRNSDCGILTEISSVSTEQYHHVIKIISGRIQELRVLENVSRRYVNKLISKIDGAWRDHKWSGAISYYQTLAVKASACIRDLLGSVDDLMYYCAVLNHRSQDFIRGLSPDVDLSQQENYQCLRTVDGSLLTDLPHNSEYIKQRSERWFNLRPGQNETPELNVVITGSTLYSGTGCGLLKDQKAHYDLVKLGKKAVHSEQTLKNFKHGNDNELNAVATLVSKIMPAYHPDLIFREDGCSIVQIGEEDGQRQYAMISGDGSGYNSLLNSSDVAFEIKCPVPGKVFTTDTFYKWPVYYVPQVLAQMKVKSSPEFGGLCYTSQSSTYIRGSSDNDLCRGLFSLASEQYGPDSKKPSRKSPEAAALADSLKEYSSKSEFIAEVPSCRAIPCRCDGTVSTVEEAHQKHSAHRQRTDHLPSMDDAVVTLTRTLDQISCAYNLLRRQAKELLVVLVSDLDRVQSLQKGDVHAVPVAYYLAGKSLKMNQVRSILHEVIDELAASGLNVKAVSSDSQFLELSLVDDDSRPSTLLKFDKTVWKKACDIPKDSQVRTMTNWNYPGVVNVGNITESFEITKSGNALRISMLNYRSIYTVKNLPSKTAPAVSTNADENEEDEEEVDDDFILQFLPSDILQDLEKNDVDAYSALRDVSRSIASRGKKVHDEEQQLEKPCEKPCEELLNVLRNSAPDNRRVGWRDTSVTDFHLKLQSATSISESFIVPELKIMLQENSCRRSGAKHVLVNLMASMYGDSSEISTTVKKKVSTLRSSAIKVLKSLPKQATNILMATNMWAPELEEYAVSSEYKPNQSLHSVDHDGSIHHFNIPYWYAQPSKIGSTVAVYCTDPHHLYVNNRGRVCAYGMLGMGIEKDAWQRIAKSKEQSRLTGLTVEIACDLADRQDHALAEITFSAKVSECMRLNGDHKEAEWCDLLRKWYEAVDAHGVALYRRVEALMGMRNFLLVMYKPGKFPPPGSYIGGMPVAQFEGLMSNIDRRLQLYNMVHGNTYNHRAIASNDCESFFSTFQDTDPKGTGVPRADDIPTIMNSALVLLRHKLNPDRKFNVQVSRKRRVYKLDQLTRPQVSADSAVSLLEKRPNALVLRAHHFDHVEDVKKTPLASTSITKTRDFRGTARGSQGVRANYKINDERKLSHTRAGIADEELGI